MVYDPPERAMPAEESKTLVRRYAEEVFNEGNLPVLDDIMVLDYVDHVALHSQASGREAFKQTLGMFRRGFPDGRVTVEDVISEGEKVAWRWTIRGTHLGEFLGVPATGRQVTWTGIIIWRISGGQIAEWWASPDTLGLMQQLGVVPTPGQG